MTPATPGDKSAASAVGPVPPISSALSDLPAPSGEGRRCRWRGVSTVRSGVPARTGACVSLVLILLALIVSLAGCGGGNGFTGGNFPIGVAILNGRAVRAEDTTVPVPNVAITVSATYATGESRTLHATTDENGAFTVKDVPTGAISATVQVDAVPDTTTTRSQQVAFRISNGHAATLIMALPAASFDVLRGAQIKITPDAVALTTGQTVPFVAQLLDSAGNVLPAAPTLLFSDDFGVIGSNGVFLGKTTGTGTVTAFWYNVAPAYASVIVNALLPLEPPAPPAANVGEPLSTPPKSASLPEKTRR